MALELAMLPLIVSFVLSNQGAPLVCPVQGEPVGKSGPTVDYNGVRYRFCCPGCDVTFKKDPAKQLKSDAIKGKVVGEAMFDPVAGTRLFGEDAKASSDHEGVRYHFVSTANRDAFLADPKKFSVAPQKEVLYCSVMMHDIANYNEAGGYVDHGDTRLYVCCGDCLAALKKDTKKFADKVAAKAKAPKALEHKD